MQQLCHLEAAVGRDAVCPEDRCGLWDDGCAVAGIRPDFATNRQLAQFLLTLRRRIEAEAPSPPLSALAFLPPGLR
jgi:hypothetical protein